MCIRSKGPLDRKRMFWLSMTLHLLKLCVGAETVEDLEAFVAARMASAGTPYSWHQTRMIPKRRDELIAGGSLYWVFKGQVAARQKLIEIEPFTDEAGISRCRLILDPSIVRTRRQPRRAFQGWRYLRLEDAPEDIMNSQIDDGLPDDLRLALEQAGIL